MIINILFWSAFIVVSILTIISLFDTFADESEELIKLNHIMIAMFQANTESAKEISHSIALANPAYKSYMNSNYVAKRYRLYNRISHAISNAQLQNSKGADKDVSYLAKVLKELKSPVTSLIAAYVATASGILMILFLAFSDTAYGSWIIRVSLSVIGFLIAGYYFYATSMIKTYYLIRKYKAFDTSEKFDKFEFERILVDNKVFRYTILTYKHFLYNVYDFNKLRRQINQKANTLIDSSSIAVYNNCKNSMEAQGDWQDSVIYLTKVCKDKDYMKDFLLNDSDSANKQIVYNKLVSSIIILYGKLSELDNVLDSLLKVQDKKRVAKAYAKGNIEQLTNEEKTDYFSKI